MKNKTQISESFYSIIITNAKFCTNCRSEPEYFFEASPIINIYLEEKLDNKFK